IGRAPPAAWAQALHRASGGLPGLAADIVRAAGGRGDDPFAASPLDAAASADAASAIATERLGRLDVAARAPVDARAVGGGRAARAGVPAGGGAAGGAGGAGDGGAIPAGLARAAAAGVVRIDGAAVAAEPVIVAAAARALDPLRSGVLAGAALDHAL